MRHLLYRLASILGWVNAAKRGKLPQRIIRVAAYKTLGKTINKFLR